MLVTAAVFASADALAKGNAVVTKDVSLNDLSFATLSSQLNTKFQVTIAPGKTLDLEMVDSNQSKAAAKSACKLPDYEQFSLVFRGPRDQMLEQGVHKFQHSNIGRFELFIVPVVSRDTKNAYYEAIFNRPVVL